MTERTICQMEVHPEIIRLRRERSELFKKWREIYGPNPFQNIAGQFQGMGQQAGNLFAGLMAQAGGQPWKPQP